MEKTLELIGRKSIDIRLLKGDLTHSKYDDRLVPNP
jgi:hypothetical protein